MRERPWLDPRSWPTRNCSYSTTSWPSIASALAAEQPMIPAPTTATCMVHILAAPQIRHTVASRGRTCHGLGVRVLIAPDGFGSTMTAREAAGAIAAGWRRGAPADEPSVLPLSDGGPGFVDVLHAA